MCDYQISHPHMHYIQSSVGETRVSGYVCTRASVIVRDDSQVDFQFSR